MMLTIHLQPKSAQTDSLMVIWWDEVANIPACACDPYLQRKLWQINGGTNAASLVNLLRGRGKTYPSKSTLEQMFGEMRLFQLRGVQEVSRLLADAWKATRTGKELVGLPDEICLFDRSICGIRDAYSSVARDEGLTRDAIALKLAVQIECRPEFVNFVFEEMPMPFALCKAVVEATKTWPKGTLRLTDIVRAEKPTKTIDFVDGPQRKLFRALLNYLYPDREPNFGQEKSSTSKMSAQVGERRPPTSVVRTAASA